MARWLFPQDATAIVYKGPMLPLLQPKHHAIKVFTDANCTIPASLVTTADAAIPNSTIYTGTDGLIPQFKGPDGLVVLYGKNLYSGRVYRMDALFSYQIADLGGVGGGGGNAFLVGSGPPSNATGNPGDAYLDSTNGFLYGPKTSVWPAGVSLKGPAGNPGGGGGSTTLAALTDVALDTGGQPFDRTAFLGRTDDGTKWTNRRVSWEMIDNKPSNFVITTDPRLIDARTPTTHSHAQSDITGLTALLATLATSSALTSGLATKVDTTRQVIAGAGLTGGGALSADRTFAVNFGATAGTVAQGNDARLSDARTPLAHVHAQTDITGLAAALALKADQTQITTINNTLATKVDNTRQVIAGTGLTGGGDLSANRTLTVAYGTTAGTAAQGNDTRITGAMQKAANGSDIASASAFRTALGLTAHVTHPYGTTASTVMEGNDARVLAALTQAVADTLYVTPAYISQYFATLFIDGGSATTTFTLGPDLLYDFGGA